MQDWLDLSTAQMTLTATLKTQKSFLLWIPLTEDDEWRVSSLCTGRYSQNSAEEEPRSFLKGSSRQHERNWTFSEECYYKSSSERACWREKDQIFSSSKKEAWKSYEILSVTAYSLFLPVIFLTRTDLSDLSVEKYMQVYYFVNFSLTQRRMQVESVMILLQPFCPGL